MQVHMSTRRQVPVYTEKGNVEAIQKLAIVAPSAYLLPNHGAQMSFLACYIAHHKIYFLNFFGPILPIINIVIYFKYFVCSHFGKTKYANCPSVFLGLLKSARGLRLEETILHSTLLQIYFKYMQCSPGFCSSPEK